MTCISIWELTKLFRIKIVGVENVEENSQIVSLYVTAGVYHGGELMSPLMTSSSVSLHSNPRWYEWITSNIQLCNVPRVCILIFFLIFPMQQIHI
jgi:hypothetical protein